MGDCCWGPEGRGWREGGGVAVVVHKLNIVYASTLNALDAGRTKGSTFKVTDGLPQTKTLCPNLVQTAGGGYGNLLVRTWVNGHGLSTSQVPFPQ